MRKTIITLVGAMTIAAMSTAALAQAGGNPTSGEGTSSGQAGRSGDRPGK